MQTQTSPLKPPGGAQEPLSLVVRDELKNLIPLAIPLAFVQLSQNMLGAVDTAVVGRLGELELAAIGLGNGLYFSLSIAGLGIMRGLDPMISQAVGADETKEADQMLWQAAWLTLILSLPLIVLIAFLSMFFASFGIEAKTAELAHSYTLSRLPGILPIMLYSGLRSYLQSYERTRPMIVSVLAANILNLPLSWALVHGDAGLIRLGLPAIGCPKFGIVGAGWTSSACSFLQMAILVFVIMRSKNITPGLSRAPDRELIGKAMRIGTPIGLTLFFEVGIFALSGLLIGNMGSRALAGHQVAITLAAASFMIPIGIGNAASVRVGQAVGRGDTKAARVAALLSLALGVAFMVLMVGLFLLIPVQLAGIVTDKETAIEAALPLIFVAAFFQLSDGAQAVLTGALRGAGDTQWPMMAIIAGHWLLGLPIGATLGFAFGFGATGIWWGLVAGLTVVSLLLTVRMWSVTATNIQRV